MVFFFSRVRNIGIGVGTALLVFGSATQARAQAPGTDNPMLLMADVPLASATVTIPFRVSDSMVSESCKSGNTSAVSFLATLAAGDKVTLVNRTGETQTLWQSGPTTLRIVRIQ